MEKQNCLTCQNLDIGAKDLKCKMNGMNVPSDFKCNLFKDIECNELPKVGKDVLAYITAREQPFVGKVDEYGQWKYYDIYLDVWFDLPHAFLVKSWKYI